MAMRTGQPANQAPNSEEAFLKQLRETFAKLPNDIPLYLFVGRMEEDVFAQACRQIVRAFRELTTKITLKEYPLDHELAGKWAVDSSPTLLLDPERYNIRWLGAPMGEEARSFLEAMILLGSGKSGMSDQSRSVIQRIDTPRHVRVFTSPTCPYCPQQVVNALRAAIERPDLISLDIVDIQCRPDLADQYGAHSVPQAFANDVLIGQGAQQEEVFMASLQRLQPAAR